METAVAKVPEDVGLSGGTQARGWTIPARLSREGCYFLEEHTPNYLEPISDNANVRGISAAVASVSLTFAALAANLGKTRGSSHPVQGYLGLCAS